MSHTSRSAARRLRGSALVVGALSLALLIPTPAIARDLDGAPVTTDDTIEIDGFSTNLADVLANDTDPDADKLAICRVTVPKKVPIYVDNVDDVLYVSSFENVTASYDVTYYACDFEHLTAGTLTVNVTKVPEVRAKKLKRPGRLKFTNPGTKKVVVLYGSRRELNPDGRVRIAGGDSAKVTVTRKKIYFVAFVRRTGSLAGEGTIKHIDLPKRSSARAVTDTFSAKARAAWAAAQ